MRYASLMTLVAAFVISGCSADAPPTATPSPMPSTWGPLAVYRADAVHDALVTGTLVITDTCAFIEVEGERWLVAWYFDPESWLWESTAQQVVSTRGRDGERFGDGDPIALGGSGTSGRGRPIETLLREMDWISPPDMTCITPTVWFASGDMSVPR